MPDFTPAPKKLAPLKLAHGQYLRNGQIISDSLAKAAPENSLAQARTFKTPKAAAPDMRSRVEGHAEISPRGMLKDDCPAPFNPGVRSRNNDPAN
jgi:hypothetical protein